MEVGCRRWEKSPRIAVSTVVVPHHRFQDRDRCGLTRRPPSLVRVPKGRGDTRH